VCNPHTFAGGVGYAGIVPSSYLFPYWMEEGIKTKLLGQSVDCDVSKSIQIEVAVALMGSRYRQLAGANSGMDPLFLISEEEGQAAFRFDEIIAG
jgi:hypothetical protein